MPILDETRFIGTLAGHGVEMPIGFTAELDDDGMLNVRLDRIPAVREAYGFFVDRRPGQPMDSLTLRGASEGGWRFVSDRFHVMHFSHPPGDELEYQGICSDAEIARDIRWADHPDMRAWFVRKLGTFHGMERQTALGRLVITGRAEGAESQRPACVLAIHADGQEVQGWWEESERFLIHLERVLSFACDSYLVPVYEQRVRGGEMVLRIVRRGRAATPYLPPFDMLYMDQIFACAIRSFEDRAEVVERLDPAIRWLTAAAPYEEARLTNAMSAIESILDRSDLPDLFMDDVAEFEALQKKVRKFLKSEGAPFGMRTKTGELNRRSLREKLEALLTSRGIVTADLPDGWLSNVIAARNLIVHTGVAPERADNDDRLFVEVVQAREVVTRVVLAELGFEGQYRSWLHGDQYLQFPSCRPMSEVAAERAAAEASPTGAGEEGA